MMMPTLYAPIAMGSHGGEHLGGAILEDGGDRDTWMPDVWERLITDYAIRSVVDVGCGAGFSTRWFEERIGCANVLGVEGDPAAFDKRRSERIVLHDYTLGPFDPGHDFDLGWTSEFVEHVDARYVANWMASLRRCRFVCMTFAVPGQGGYHHVNEQPEEYWLEKFAAAGFEHVPKETARLRATSSGQVYGRPTLTFFRRTT
jgi:SAM-dependent methyltransferase